jgi:Arc/MetJ-type ribon-helix-helix transcriptional regulator
MGTFVAVALGSPTCLFRGYQVGADGMALGMARTMKVTLPAESEEAIRRLVADGNADSVSGFVQHAVQVSLDDVAGWAALLGQALADTGGEMTDQERQWADQVLGGSGTAGTAARAPASRWRTPDSRSHWTGPGAGFSSCLPAPNRRARPSSSRAPHSLRRCATPPARPDCRDNAEPRSHPWTASMPPTPDASTPPATSPTPRSRLRSPIRHRRRHRRPRGPAQAGPHLALIAG